MSRVVLITGGSRGIGLATAKRFAAMGDKVAVTYNSSAPSGDFLAVKCDVTNESDVERAFTEVENALGPVEVLVSNAGITKDGLLLRMKEDDFTSVVDTNLTVASSSFRASLACWDKPAKRTTPHRRRVSLVSRDRLRESSEVEASR